MGIAACAWNSRAPPLAVEGIPEYLNRFLLRPLSSSTSFWFP